MLLEALRKDLKESPTGTSWRKVVSDIVNAAVGIDDTLRVAIEAIEIVAQDNKRSFMFNGRQISCTDEVKKTLEGTHRSMIAAKAEAATLHKQLDNQWSD